MADLYVDPEMAAIADAMANSPMPSIQDGDIAQMRALLSSLSPRGGEEMASVTDMRVSGVPVREYLAGSAVEGTIILFHGGGWVLGCVEDYDYFARTLAWKTRCRILSVDYRLAPEHRFPSAVEDAWSVVSSVAVDHPLFVLGDSAGGNLAAVTAQMMRDWGTRKLAGQILIYPSVAGDVDSEAMHAFEPPMMPISDIVAFYDLYIPDRDSRRDVRFAPFLGRLDGLAPALVIAAGADLFANEARQYADALADAGVRVTLHEQEGALHAFLTLFPQTSAAQRTLDVICEFISKQIDETTIPALMGDKE